MALVAVLVVASYWVLKFVLAGTLNDNPYSCSGTPTLQSGSNDNGTNGCVHYLQYDLNYYGYNLTKDGAFGTNTKNAVIDYQSKHSLSKDGVVGSQTWASINHETAKVFVNSFCLGSACSNNSSITVTPSQSLTATWDSTPYADKCQSWWQSTSGAGGNVVSGVATWPTKGSANGSALSSTGTYYFELKCLNDIWHYQTERKVVIQQAPPTTTTISGRVYDTRTNTGISGVSLNTCQGTAKTNSSGNFSFTANIGSGFCLRVTAGIPGGYSGPTTSQNPEVGNSATTYEYQIAGKNCYHSCANQQGTYDRNSDSGYNFAYTSPTPTVKGCGAGTDNSTCKPTVSLKINGASAATVDANTNVTMSWTLGFSPSSCSATGDWSGAKTPTNASTVVNVGAAGNKTYILTCNNANGPGSSSVTAVVKAVGGGKLPNGCGPGTNNSTCTIHPGTTGSGKNLVSDKTPPSVPGNFKAKLGSSTSTVVLSWNASTDTSGINSYQLERSTDKVKWQVLSTKIVTTGYTDDATTYKTAYSYRLRAVDNAGNASGYASTDIVTGEFKATTDGTLIESGDHVVQVTLPLGALGSTASCSIEVNSDNVRDLSVLKLELVHGPYELACKTPEGDFLDSFKKPIQVSVYPDPKKAKKYKALKIYQYDFEGGTWKEVQVKTAMNNQQPILSFETDKPFQIAVMGVRKPGLPWGIISFILLILIAAGVAFVIYLRRAQKQHYQDYLRRKYYNL